MNSVPDYIRITATALVGLTYLCALGIAVDVYVAYGPSAQLPGVVSFVLGTGLGVALNALGLHTGISLGGTTNARTESPDRIGGT
jgi:hypothetical protein